MDASTDMTVKARLTGARKGAKTQIELAIFAPQKRKTSPYPVLSPEG
jgi:hypothetical protein